MRTLIRHKRYTDFLRHNLDHSLELAVTDPLTGLHNRRYMSGQLGPLVKPGASRRASSRWPRCWSTSITSSASTTPSGHDIGDEVLREFAVRLATNVRAIDLACRLGGEEFVVIMPDTGIEAAHRVAERLRLHVSGAPFRVQGPPEPLAVTVSIGVAATVGEGDTPDALIKRADSAVYEAKRAGRNQVISSAA